MLDKNAALLLVSEPYSKPFILIGKGVFVRAHHDQNGKITVFTCLILVLLATLFVGSVSKRAERDLGERADTLGLALRKAIAYSVDTGGIGIALSYGSGNEKTPKEAGDALVEEIEKRGQKARYFFYESEGSGAALSYRIGHSSRGPWGLKNAVIRVGEVVEWAEFINSIRKN